MIEKIESKITEVVEAIIEKPANDFTKTDYDILAAEFYRLKSKIDAVENNKKMADMLTTLWIK